MKNIESNFEEQSEFMDNDEDDLPPIRSGNITLTADGVSFYLAIICVKF
jgi:hypothetical protein